MTTTTRPPACGALRLGAPGAASIVASVLAAACGPDRIDRPVPPDLSEIVAAYERPQGLLDPALAPTLLAEVATRTAVLEESRAAFLVADALVTLRDRLDAAGFPVSSDDDSDEDSDVDSDDRRLDAYGRITRVCQGWDPGSTTPNPGRDGELVLTATIDDGRLGRTVWGTATRCRERVAVTAERSANALLSGAVAVYLADGLPARVEEAAFVVRFAGAIGTDERQVDLPFDFLFRYPDVELRLPGRDGDVIAGVGPETISLRGRNGVVTCARETGACDADVDLPPPLE
jgi:hypothetical protein